jgi:hypothetical protein
MEMISGDKTGYVKSISQEKNHVLIKIIKWILDSSINIFLFLPFKQEHLRL